MKESQFAEWGYERNLTITENDTQIEIISKSDRVVIVYKINENDTLKRVLADLRNDITYGFTIGDHEVGTFGSDCGLVSVKLNGRSIRVNVDDATVEDIYGKKIIQGLKDIIEAMSEYDSKFVY